MRFFDLHCDTAYKCYIDDEEFDVKRLAVSGECGKVFDEWSQTFAVWIKDNQEKPFLLYKNILSDFKSKLGNKPQNLRPIFAVEGGAVLENDSDRIFELWADGIKLLTLTWNGENNIAGGCHTDKGLTNFGKTVIEKMNHLKIGCDLSHLNEKSFFAALDKSVFPLATHSNCKSICDNPRNLTDQQIKVLCKRGGIIGLCFYPDFLGQNVMQKIYENIYHIADMGFENSIAIGSDFDGGEMDKSLDKISKVPDLYAFLSEKGLERGFLDKIFFKNANNYIAKLK